MTTSKHSQARMFDDGFTPEQSLPTPTAFDAKPIRNLRQDNNALDGGRHGVSLGHLIENRLDGFSPPATRVSHSAMPGSDEARRMTVTSGRTFADSLPMPGRAGACLRTLLGTSAWDSTMCLLTWKVKATPAGRRLFRLQASAPRTSGTGSGSSPVPETWWTPSAAVAHRDFTLTPQMGIPRQRSGLSGNLNEQMAARLWPTPDTGMVTGDRALPPGTTDTGMTPDGRKVQVGLTNAVKMWPTPTMQDGENTAGPSQFRRNSLPLNAAVMWPTPRATESELRTFSRTPSQEAGKHGKYLAVEAGQTPAMKLSAVWVGRLMGYPDGWLDLES